MWSLSKLLNYLGLVKTSWEILYLYEFTIENIVQDEPIQRVSSELVFWIWFFTAISHKYVQHFSFLGSSCSSKCNTSKSLINSIKECNCFLKYSEKNMHIPIYHQTRARRYSHLSQVYVKISTEKCSLVAVAIQSMCERILLQSQVHKNKTEENEQILPLFQEIIKEQ